MLHNYLHHINFQIDPLHIISILLAQKSVNMKPDGVKPSSLFYTKH